MKRRTSSSGSVMRNSTMQNATNNTSPPISATRTRASPHPRCGASRRPKTIPVTPKTDRAVPPKSKRPGLLSREVPIVRHSRAVTRADAAKVMKIECHEKNSSRTPVTKNPAIAPAPATAAQMLTAILRLSAGTPEVISDSVVGMMSAAATPARIRVQINWVGSVVQIASSEATEKTTRPTIRTSRRPKRSPMAPAGSSSAARANV
ncbi:Uncharacterised protein [Mycobacteroides abscessus subsp. abscessus]|nr:Uncharacterised protein [Mycobacteroides abscessus subsp. abscessus]